MSSMPATVSGPDCTLIVPVYRNEENIPHLLDRFAELNRQVSGGIEVICVVDGSPDRSHELLEVGLSRAPYPSRLLLLSRNFGSFAAIREGLKAADGRYFAVMAADLQEPAELTTEAFAALQRDECDVTLGTRIAKIDPPQGFAAQTSCATMLWTTAHFGFPVSTTHVISGSVMGAGATRGLHAVRWGVAGNIVTAWIFTIPMAGLVGAGMELITRLPGGDLIVFVLAAMIAAGAFGARRWETRRLLPPQALESAPI